MSSETRDEIKARQIKRGESVAGDLLDRTPGDEGALIELPGDNLVQRVATRMGRHILATVDPYNRINRYRYPIHDRERTSVLRALGRADAPKHIKSVPGYVAAAGTLFRQVPKAVGREIGERTRITPVRDFGREFVNSHPGEKGWKARGRTALRFTLQAPLLPGYLAESVFTTAHNKLSESIQRTQEDLGTKRKRTILGHFAASTVVLWGVQNAMHVAHAVVNKDMSALSSVSLPDFSSFGSGVSSTVGETVNTWQAAADAVVHAPADAVHLAEKGIDTWNSLDDTTYQGQPSPRG